MVFSGRCCDLVQVKEWFRESGRAYCAPVVLKVGWVYCVAVLDMCLLKPCYMFFCDDGDISLRISMGR